MMLYVMGGLAVLSAAMVVYALWPKPKESGETVKRRMLGRSSQPSTASIRQQAKDSVAKRVMETVAPLAVRPVMLDNMDAESMHAAVRQNAGRCVLEASGGITLETVREVAETGVDLISVGWITHSAPALDVALDFHAA